MLPDKITRMLFTSDPKPDESFMGYLLRLTESNRAATPSWMLRAARIKSYVRAPLDFVFDNTIDFSPLAALAEVSEDTLKSLPYQPVRGVRRKFGEYLFFGLPVFRYVIRPRRPKICSECLRESGYIKKVWEFALVTACPLHKCLLLGVCPKCEEHISWIRPKVCVCRCEFDWRVCRPEPTPDSDLEVTRRVHSLCGLPGGVPTEDKTERHTPLYGLGLQPFASALIFIASQLTGVSREKWQRVLDTTGKTFGRKQTNAENHSLLTRALTAFENWPDNFYSFLDVRRSEKSGGELTGPWRNYFAEYKSALFAQLAAPDFEFIRRAFRDYRRIRRNASYFVGVLEVARKSEPKIGVTVKDGENTSSLPVKAGSKSKHLLGLPEDKIQRLSGTHVSGATAKMALRTTWGGLKRLIACGKLKSLVSSSEPEDPYLPEAAYIIEKESLEELRKRFENALSLKQVERLLGVHVGRVEELIDCGLLNPLRDPDVDGSGRRTFDQEEASGLVSKLLGGLPVKRRVSKNKTLSFKSVLRKIGRAGIGLGTFLQAVLDGEIKLLGKTEGGDLRCLLFSDKQITAYARSEFRLLVGDALSLQEASKLLGVTRQASRFFVEKGFLQAEVSERAPSLGMIVKREEFDSFNEKYIKASRVAAKRHISTNSLIDVLGERKVTPVTGPKIDGGFVYLFKRSNIWRFDLTRLIADWKKKQAAQLPSYVLDEAQVADVLRLSIEVVRQLVERGLLKPIKRLSFAPCNGGKYFFTSFIIEKYKNDSINHASFIRFTAVAKLFNLWPNNFYNRFVKTGRLKPAVHGGERSQDFFRVEDVNTLLEIERQTIITPEAAEILGVNVSCIDKMVESGILRPISGPKVDGFGKNLFLRGEVEHLHGEREAYKAGQVREGKSCRFGRSAGPANRPVQDVVGPHIDLLIGKWREETPDQHISGYRLHRQLVADGYKTGINTVYVYLRQKNRKAA